MYLWLFTFYTKVSMKSIYFLGVALSIIIHPAPQGAGRADFWLKTTATATERRRMFVQNVSVIW